MYEGSGGQRKKYDQREVFVNLFILRWEISVPINIKASSKEAEASLY